MELVCISDISIIEMICKPWKLWTSSAPLGYWWWSGRRASRQTLPRTGTWIGPHIGTGLSFVPNCHFYYGANSHCSFFSRCCFPLVFILQYFSVDICHGSHYSLSDVPILFTTSPHIRGLHPVKDHTALAYLSVLMPVTDHESLHFIKVTRQFAQASLYMHV